MLNAIERQLAFSYCDSIIPSSGSGIALTTRSVAADTVKFVRVSIPNSTICKYHVFGMVSGMIRRGDCILDPRLRGKSQIIKNK